MSETQPPPPEGNERRLAAIVFTDVAGYSARMQRDETGTLTLVRADFERMRTLCAQHGGEVLKSTGDGLLLCFSSVVQAVVCALAIQGEFGRRGADALQHRIGIHLGDVFREGGDVAGDGVNIAARLQTKARPGTICLSQSVYDAVKGKVPMQVEPLGPQQFKNIAEAIRVYLSVTDGTAMPAAAKRTRWPVGVAVALILAGLAAVFWPKSAPVAPAATPPAQTEARAKDDRSIAVLPFENISEDKENAFFADGMHEDVLTNLANISDLRVVSRTSVMQYRNTTKTMQQIAIELGVAYILESSVRREGNTVRVTAHLINARTDEPVWGNHYDRELKDVFAIQSALATEIADTLQVVLTPRDKARLQRAPTSNTAAYLLYLKALDVRRQVGENLDGFNRAESLLQSAVELDPQFAAAWGELAAAHVGINSRSYDPTGVQLEKARQAIENLERLAPDEPETWMQLGSYYATRGDYARSDDYVQRAAKALPYNGRVVMMLADADKRRGSVTDTLLHYRRAFELDRQNPEIRARLRSWLLATRHYVEAERFERENQNPGDDGYTLAQLAFCARGSTREMEAWLKAHPSANIETVMEWRFLTGDVAAFIKLAVKFRDSMPTGYLSPLWEAHYGAALMALGETDRARQEWAGNLARLKVENIALTKVGDHSADVGESAMLAFLGEKPAALAAMEGWLARKQKSGVVREFEGRDGLAKIVILSWVGETDQALAELTHLLKIPAGLNVHELRHNPFLRPLQGDPRFEALLDDPMNNEPLLDDPKKNAPLH